MIKTRILIVIAGTAALAACGRLLWLMIEDGSWGWSLGAGVYTVFLITILIGMWQGKSGAFRLSRILALIMFGFGCWAAHFAWTFWLFQEPTLADRVFAVANPRISVYLAGPVIWLFLSCLSGVRAKFEN